MDLVVAVYDSTEAFPKREVYSLTGQLRRAAVSVPSNIAEGQAHFNNREFLHFLRYSTGSLAELETQIMAAERIGYFSGEKSLELLTRIQEIGRLLHGLINSLSLRSSTASH